MKNIIFLASFMLSFSHAFAEQPSADEIIAKVRAAAAFLEQHGSAGLDEFNKKESPWFFKETYVFVYNCSADKIAAHVSNQLIGKEVSKLLDQEGTYLGLEICAAALEKNGQWIEYWWPKADSEVPQRKISYVLSVPNQPYEVGAGIYEPTIAVKELNEKLSQISSDQ